MVVIFKHTQKPSFFPAKKGKFMVCLFKGNKH